MERLANYPDPVVGVANNLEEVVNDFPEEVEPDLDRAEVVVQTYFLRVVGVEVLPKVAYSNFRRQLHQEVVVEELKYLMEVDHHLGVAAEVELP